MTRPAAYLRKSKDSGTKADHLAILMETVKAYGHNGDTQVYDDWARSGDVAKLAKRAGWRAMCEAIEAGEHDVVFMNDLDRGGRSIEEWARFMRVARDRGVRVIAGGVDWSDKDRKLEFHIRASFAEEELDRAKARSARTVQIRRRRGDVVTGGHAAPYGQMWMRAGAAGLDGDPRRIVAVPNPAEPIEPILDAVREKGGSVLKAAKLLNERGIPSRGGNGWEPKTLARIVDAHGGSRLRGKGKRAPAEGTAPLARLVVCHCGQVMTPTRDPRNGRWLSLYCLRGHRAGAASHGPYTARARHVLDRLRSDLKGKAVKAEEIWTTDPDAAAAEREDLRRRRRLLGIALADETIDEDEYRRRLDAIDAAIADLDDAYGPAFTLRKRTWGPVVRWDGTDDEIGEDLRRAVRAVRLGADMRPASVELR